MNEVIYGINLKNDINADNINIFEAPARYNFYIDLPPVFKASLSVIPPVLVSTLKACRNNKNN